MRGRIYPNKGGYVVRFGRGISKWFKNKVEAERMLNHLRYQVDNNLFDPRDYASDKPLSFRNLAENYVEHKRLKVKPRSWNNINNYMTRAIKAWDATNVKAIGYAEIEDFLLAQNVSDKTRSNIKSCLHDFWTWIRKRRVITLAQCPEFPETPFELGYRNITTIETQQNILQEIKRQTYHIDPKIWLGIKWLCTYIGMRPGEMINVKEEDILLDQGMIFIRNPKEKSRKGPKLIYLNDDDIDILKKMPRGLPHLYFFRHPAGISGCQAGQRYGARYLYKKFKKACDVLNVEKLDLYGFSRHTTASALGDIMTPEQIRQGTLHSTNRAFERYFQPDARNAKKVYQAAKGLQQTYNIKQGGEKGKILKLKE